MLDSQLVQAFVAADIPIHKLSHPKLRAFLESQMKYKIKHPSTYRRRISSLAADVIAKVKEKVADNDVFFVIDETPDCRARNVVNLLVGVMNGQPTKPMLLIVSFPEDVNNKTIQELVYDACNILWEKQNRYPRLHLILSDQAKYMTLAVKKMKEQDIVFPHLHHISCLLHAVDLVCFQIMVDSQTVNSFLVEEKHFFKNSGKRKRIFKTETQLPLPPFPVITRWGSWLTAVKYHVEHFDAIKHYFTECCDVKSAKGPVKTLANMKRLLALDDMANELMSLHTFLMIPKLMKQMESECLKVTEQMELLSQIQEIIKDTRYTDVLQCSLRKNPDFLAFFKPDISLKDRINRIYCPLNSCAVERSFSVYKSMLSDRRLNLLPATIRDLMVIKCNQFL